MEEGLGGGRSREGMLLLRRGGGRGREGMGGMVVIEGRMGGIERVG